MNETKTIEFPLQGAPATRRTGKTLPRGGSRRNGGAVTTAPVRVQQTKPKRPLGRRMEASGMARTANGEPQ
jgi:hypothetical protein